MNASNKAAGSPAGQVQSVKQSRMGNRLIWFLLPVLGTLFSVWYIQAAAADVVYTDYIRLINDYLPDVTNLDKFLVPDIFTRIPISFLQRIINVKLFGYSVTFDRLCTVAGLFLCALALTEFVRRLRISVFVYAAVMAVLFSLNKWEILLNGTAWAHVAAFGLFFINYELLDRVLIRRNGAADTREGTDMRESARKGGAANGRPEPEEMLLPVFPFLILLVAGEYIASYACVMMLITLGFVLGIFPTGVRERKRAGVLFVCTLLALLIYLVSRHFAVWEHAGATEESIFSVIAAEPLFLPRFFIKTFAGAVLGQETIQNFYGQDMPLQDGVVVLLGLFVIAGYLLSLYLYIRKSLYKQTVFPLILLLSGGFNHVLVTFGRWIFLRESYALSSRYSAQFMIGLIGILLTLGLLFRAEKTKGTAENDALPKAKKAAGMSWSMRALTLLAVLILWGNGYTTLQEINKAKYREENYEEMVLMLRNSDDYSAEELCSRLDWHKDPALLYHAIDILKENRLNVFR